MRYLILLGALGAAILGYTVYWFSLAGRVEDGVNAWAHLASQQGMPLDYDSVSVTGYPFRLVANIKGLDWHFPTAGNDLRWQTSRLRIVAEPWVKNHIIVIFDKKQAFTVTPKDGPARAYEVISKKARASLVTQVEGAGRFAFAADSLDISAKGSDQHLTTGSAQFSLRDVPPKSAKAADKPKDDNDPNLPPTAQADFLVKSVTLPAGKGGALGDVITDLQAEAVVNGQLSGVNAAQLGAWAKSGGTIDITGLKTSWGSLSLEAAGTLTLDESDRPLGAFETRFKSVDGMLGALGLLGETGSTSRLAREALETARKNRTGKWIKVPVTLQNGFLYMGSIPLAALSPVTD